DDSLPEATETFDIVLSNPTGGALGANATVTIGIADDDLGPGSLDTTFDPGKGADGTIYSMAVQPDGKIVIGGQFLNFNDIAAHHVGRLTPDGAVDDTFN